MFECGELFLGIEIIEMEAKLYLSIQTVKEIYRTSVVVIFRIM